MESRLKDSRFRQRTFLLEQFQKGEKSALKIWNQLKETFGKDAMGKSTMNWWLSRFRRGNFQLDDGQRVGRPPRVLDDEVGREIEVDPYATSVDLALRLKRPWARVKLYLQRHNIVSVSGMWVAPLTEDLRQLRIDYCKDMIERYSDPSFWSKVLFEGERIIYYNKNTGRNGKANVKKQLQCTNFQDTDLKLKSTVLRVWWTAGGYIRFRFTPVEQQTEEDYAKELQLLYEDMETSSLVEDVSKWTLHRNEDPSSSTSHCPDVLASFGWSSMVHPLRCPDLSPTDYYFFMKFYAAFSTYNNFQELRDVEEFMVRHLRRKNLASNQKAVDILPEKWHRVIETEGEYIGTHERVE